MKRMSDQFKDPDASVAGQQSRPPVEALLVDRPGLIRILKRSLGELHEHRQRLAGTAVERETVGQIKYWAEVLDWVKGQEGADLMLVRKMT